ncbi:MAG: hypothetical protein ABSG53_18395 [Thermoguttaceae bacterium]
MDVIAMRWLGLVVAAVLMAVVLIDASKVVLLSRRVRHGLRLARLLYRTSWKSSGRGSRALHDAKRAKRGHRRGRYGDARDIFHSFSF